MSFSKFPRDFELEKNFERFEFKEGIRILSNSDGQPVKQTELLELADEETKKMWNELELGYTNMYGHKKLVEALHKELYPGAAEDQILPVIPAEGIYLTMQCLVEQTRRLSSNGGKTQVISVFPAYQSLYETLSCLNMDIKYWEMSRDDSGKWILSIEDLKLLISDKTKGLVVNFPHNPTGFSPSDEMWTEIINICKENKLFLFSDEMYSSLALENSTQSVQFALTPAFELYDKAVTLSGLSKCFGLAGLRLGWLVTKDKSLLDMARRLRMYTTICLPAPVEILGIIAVKNQKTLLDRIKQIIFINIEVARNFFESNSKWLSWQEPIAGSLALAEMSERILDHFANAKAFSECLAEKYGLLIIPSGDMEFDDRYFRVGLARTDFHECLRRLQKCLDEC